MKPFWIFWIVAANSLPAWGPPGGVLEKVTKIQVDPTVIEHPEKVDDSLAPSLVQYNLRAAVKDAHLEEGDSSIRAHIVLDSFSSEGTARRVIGFESGRRVNTVDGRLVIQDATGKELAGVKLHVHGTVAFTPGDGNEPTGHPATSDLEQRLLQQIEKLK